MPDYLKKLFTVDDKIVTYRFVNGVYQARFRRDGYVNDGRNRTAQKLYTMLKAIFSVACEDFGIKSPMAKVTLPHYEIKKGKAFTKADEKTIIEFCKANPHYAGNSSLLVLLYTGMRVGELETLTYDDTFIYCKSEKTRKGYADVIRQIPISPMLRKVLPLIDLEQVRTISSHTVRDAIKRIFPDRHIHENYSQEYVLSEINKIEYEL